MTKDITVSVDCNNKMCNGPNDEEYVMNNVIDDAVATGVGCYTIGLDKDKGGLVRKHLGYEELCRIVDERTGIRNHLLGLDTK